MLERFNQFEIQDPIKIIGGSSSDFVNTDVIVVSKYPGSDGIPLT